MPITSYALLISQLMPTTKLTLRDRTLYEKAIGPSHLHDLR